jgi:hypothetical protein
LEAGEIALDATFDAEAHATCDIKEETHGEALLKVRPYDRSTLWRSAFAEQEKDPDERDRQALAGAYQQLRDRAGDIVNEIHAVLPQLTVHDLTHADTLWDVASEVCGAEYKLNPLEGFVLGASFLLHDAGMALAAYPGGLKELEDSVEWRDAVVSILKQKGIEDPSDSQRTRPDDDVRNEAIFQILRGRHASQAAALATAIWKHPITGHSMALVQNEDLLESYGQLIGSIAASHHWPLPEVARYFGDPTPASAAWPREWEVDGLLLACILRCADASAIDETRAPSFLFAIRKPSGGSKRHWAFQNKIYPAKRRDDGLVFESKSPFSATESDDWWLCFDAIEVADGELRGSDALLTDRQRRPFAARRVIGAGNPDILIQSVKVVGWKPVNTQPKISDPQSIIERLGGKQLYGDDPLVPLRELLQNSVDAIRARRFLDPHFAPAANDRFPGRILLEIKKVEGSNDFWIAVEDNGLGMSETTITRTLLDFGNSFWSSQAAAKLYPGLPSERNFRPIGKFGIGFFSIFMYSEIAEVMSREFKAALDVWSILSFQHGVRGRGNFSIGKRPPEVASADASTRIQIRVDDSFLWSLAAVDRRSVDTEDEQIIVLQRQIASKLSRLVCALDVKVCLSFLDQGQLSLNDPLIYEKDLEQIWAQINSGGRAQENQKRLLAPLGTPPDQLFGYCGLNIDAEGHRTYRSVGGLISASHYSREDAIVGIAEYKVTAANREPEKLAAPKVVIEAWAKEQIKRVLSEPLTDSERQYASESLGKLIDDTRSIFFIRTSEGGLSLDSFISALRKFQSVRIVVDSYKSEGVRYYYSAPPRPHSELQLHNDDVEFSNFFLALSGADIFLRAGSDGKLYHDHALKTYSTIWATVFSTLADLGIDFTIELHEQQEIGKYVGPDSPRHLIKKGDALIGDVVELRINR